MLFGLLYCMAIAAFATALAPFLGAYVNSLLLAIVFGMLLGNTLYPRHSARADRGVQFAKKTVLRAAIVLYGLRLSVQQLGQLGLSALLLDSLMLASTFMLTLFLAKRFFRMDEETAVLMGAGASICGAAAVLATEGLIKAPAHKTSLAIATVVVFGTLSLFVYPLLYASQLVPLNPEQFGIYIGAAVHEVAQVVAAGGMLGQAVADTAIVSKMTRVLLLAPFLLLLSLYWQKRHALPQQKAKLQVPSFALGFIVMVLLNSLLPASAQPFVNHLITLDNFMLCTAMVALGLGTQFKALTALGWAPFALGLCIFLWLLLGGALLSVLLL